jgi:hypothetical protein
MLKENKRMIAYLTPKAMRDRLDSDTTAARLLSEVVCSTYWGGDVDLSKLVMLNESDWALAMTLLDYRRSGGEEIAGSWYDTEFYTLACWCRIRHSLMQYADNP